MAEPNFRDHRIYILPLFQVLAERGAAKPSDVYDEVANRVGVTAAQRQERGPRGTDNPIYRNRIQFARQSLIDAQCVVGPDAPTWQRGIWELSPEGKLLAKSGRTPTKLNDLLQQRAAEGIRERARQRAESIELAGLEPSDESEDEQEDARASRERDASGLPPLAAELPSPPDLRSLVEQANQTAMTAMLEHIRGMSDRAFEYLVGSVLKEALRAETVTITPKSRDGGFDGVLTFDSLGMRIAVFEAKRYGEGNVVGRPLLDAFATAARRRRATHSLFITSSRFSAEAIEAAKHEAIRLVDGVAFVELMAKHGFGLRPSEQFTLYEIDPAWSVTEEFDE